MHWVSPWRTTAVGEDSDDGQDGDSDQEFAPGTDSITKEWDSLPKTLQDDYTEIKNNWDSCSDSEVDIYMGEEEYEQEKWLKTDGDYEGDWEEEGEEEEEEAEDWDSSMPTEYLKALKGLFPLLQKGQQTNENSWGSESELEFLRDGESEKLCSMKTSLFPGHI